MIKKFLLSFLMMTLIPITGLAISLEELQNNPTRYVRIHHDQRSSAYADTDSVKIVHHDSPHYTIQGTFYKVDFVSSKIMRDKLSISYDSQKSYPQRLEAAHKAHPDQSEEFIRTLIHSEQIKDSGMTLDVAYTMAFYFSGAPKFKKELCATEYCNIPIKPNTIFGTVAEYFWLKCHNTTFTGFEIPDLPT